MLSPFPELYDWYFAVPTIFRFVLAWYVIGTARRMRVHGNTNEEAAPWTILAILLLFLAGSLVLGLFVQYAGAVGFVLGIAAVRLVPSKPSFLTESRAFYILAAVMSLSLVFLGPGIYAIGVAF